MWDMMRFHHIFFETLCSDERMILESGDELGEIDQGDHMSSCGRSDEYDFFRCSKDFLELFGSLRIEHISVVRG